MNSPVLDSWGGELADRKQALLHLLRLLDDDGYEFIPPTPLTYRRVLSNGSASAASPLRRLFGWSCTVDAAEVSAELIAIMDTAGVLECRPGGIRSTVRVSRAGNLFLHSAYPTDDVDAVFFGPDSYRFARLIEQEIGDRGSAASIVDIGTGSGIGALTAARLCHGARVIGTDINPLALQLARINAEHAGQRVEFVETGNLAGVGPVDLAVANPPYIIDAGKRHYRDGGDALGTGVAVAMATTALSHLNVGGRLILYTGSPVIDGIDPLRSTLQRICNDYGAVLRYTEIDPDVFGEELERPAYAGVERIALIAAVAQRVGP